MAHMCLKSQHLEDRRRNLCEFEVSLVYVVSCRTGNYIMRLCLKKKKLLKKFRHSSRQGLSTLSPPVGKISHSNPHGQPQVNAADPEVWALFQVPHTLRYMVSFFPSVFLVQSSQVKRDSFQSLSARVITAQCIAAYASIQALNALCLCLKS